MGLQSALTTALTGLQAAETTIDVAGNNVANSSTDGFKQSHVLFANQFLQTQSIGSAPSATNGGTNPRQIGLGVKVAAINPDFSQGTIQISSNPLDVAIQGDGFLIVQGAAGQEYTRNGQLQTNSSNQVVTATGAIVLGQAADANFNIDSNSGLVPLTIPLGTQSVTQATKNATLSGVLTPLADIGTAGVITSAPLGDFTVEFPPGSLNSNTQLVGPPITSGSTGVATAGTSANTAGSYEYKVVWFSNSTQASKPSESAPSAAIAVPGVNAGDTIVLSGLPVDNSASPLWDGRRIYRSTDGGTTFNQIGPDLPVTGATFSDTGALTSGVALDTKVLDQKPYSYYVTFAKTGLESRPSSLIGPYSVSDTTSRVRLDNIPQPTGTDGFDKINIYRNTGANPSDFELVDTLSLGTTSYVDEKSDAEIVANNHPLDQLGAKAATTTLLTDVVVQDGSSYSRPFVPGTLSFTGTRGGRTLDTKTFTITSTSNVGDLETFMSQAFGIDTSDINSASGHAGVALSNGQIVFTSNDGVENALGVDLTSLSLKPAASGSPTTSVALKFNTTTSAVGAGSTTDFVVFDKLGEPIKLRITTALETKSGTDTTYRWFATSGDNQPADPTNVSTFLGSGLLTFDANGVLRSDLATPKIAILHPSEDPLGVTLDFSHVTGLAQTDSLGNNVSVVNLTQQDGFPPGTLTSFTITESGLIRGVFSNGAERPLGTIRMARFANNTGLTQNGNNLYTQGINSGAAVIGNPGDNGVGTLTSGAVELSNADIGQNLIDLILASTQYRGGARVITTAQQLFDELLQLRAG